MIENKINSQKYQTVWTYKMFLGCDLKAVIVSIQPCFCLRSSSRMQVEVSAVNSLPRLTKCTTKSKRVKVSYLQQWFQSIIRCTSIHTDPIIIRVFRSLDYTWDLKNLSWYVSESIGGIAGIADGCWRKHTGKEWLDQLKSQAEMEKHRWALGTLASSNLCATIRQFSGARSVYRWERVKTIVKHCVIDEGDSTRNNHWCLSRITIHPVECCWNLLKINPRSSPVRSLHALMF